MNLLSELHSLLRALDEHDVDYALCGGLAMAVHGFPRATMDIDLLVPAQSVDVMLGPLGIDAGFGIDGGRLPLQTLGTDLVRRTKVVGDSFLPLDLILLCPRLGSVWATRERLLWRGERLWVLSRAGLIEMKRLAARPQDLADLARLEAS